MQSFEIDAVTIKKSMTEYHHWINGLAHNYSNTVVYGENEYGESGHLSIFTLLKYTFFRASCLHLTKDTDTM